MARYDDQFMRHSDALAWNMEHDPGMRSTIVGVTWLDVRPDLEVLTARCVLPDCSPRHGGSIAISTSPSTCGVSTPRIRTRRGRWSSSPGPRR